MRSINVLAAILITCVVLGAQTPPEPPHRPQPAIRASGEATVTAKPDRVIIDIAVVTEAPTAQAAAAQNATKLDAVLRTLKTAAGAAADIKTVSYSLDPSYRYPKPGSPPEIAGYTARNAVQVTTPELDSAGKIIDAATRAGANNIDRLQFTLKNDQTAQGEALREAAAKARASAEAMAAALGVRLGKVLLAEESGGVQPLARPAFAMARMAESAMAPPTPVSPGTIEVRASVTVTFEIAQ